MQFIWESIRQAAALLFPPNAEITGIILLSIAVSGSATILAGITAIPLGIFLSLKRFRGKRLVISLLQTSMSVPAVLIGLFVYMMINRRGLLGFLALLFTPGAMILAQALLAFPLIASLTLSALKGIAGEGRDLAYSLGASPWKMAWTVVRQGRFAFLTALITGFSRVVGETGMTLMIGGNIKGMTRVMTTAISLETMKGNFEIGLALGLVLLIIALMINLVLQWVQGK